MSRPGVDESLEWDFIKVILTKDQERSEEDKKQMWIGKSGCIELDRTHCCTKNFNIASSLCGVLEVTFYFSKSFLEAVAEASWPASWDRSPTCGLLYHNRDTDYF